MSRGREQCAICLNNLFDQEIGIPECCKHVFCFTCLVNWSKQEHSCPNDRGIFQFILKKHSITSRKPFAKVNVDNTELEISLEEEEEGVKDIISCYICDNEDQEYHPLLTCKECRKSYHEFCLNSFNTSTWICPSCECNNEERSEPVNNLLMVKPSRAQTSLGDQDRTGRISKSCHSSSTTIPTQEKHRNTTSVRSVITPEEAARRITARGLSVLPDPRSAALTSQTQYMTALRRKRKLVARLPPRIPINQLPRIKRRSDAPRRSRSKTITQKSNSLANASFLDKLLHSQSQLHSLKNFQIQGAHIKLS